eukprot:jgi/Botrbrau1/16454/Bobra.0142s0050.1
MGTDLNFPWQASYGHMDLLPEFIDCPQDFDLQGGDLGLSLRGPQTVVTAPAWGVIDQERWKSSSTSSSNGDCCADEQHLGLSHSGGARKPPLPLRSGLHANEDIHNKAREKNKAAQRAYRQRTKEKAQQSQQRIKELEARVEKLQLERDVLSQKNSLLEATNRLTEPRMSLSCYLQGEHKGMVHTNEVRPGDGWDDLRALRGTLVLTRLKSTVVKLTEGDIKSMDVPALQDIWKAYTATLAHKLVRADLDIASPVVSEIKAVLDEMLAVGASVSIHNPVLKMGMQKAKRTSDIDWADITQKLHLREDQKDQLLHMQRKFIGVLGDLFNRRTQLAAKCQVSVSLPTLSSTAISEDFYTCTVAAARLQENLDQQHCLMCMNAVKCMREVLTPMQLATMLVTLHPNPPDVLSIMNEVAKERGQEIFVPQMIELPREEGKEFYIQEPGEPGELALRSCKHEKAPLKFPGVCQSF